MYLIDAARHKSWATLFGYLLFIGMMAVGYYYNLTFIQLGLVDLGRRVIGMSERQVAMDMALLALLTALVALAAAFWLQRRGWYDRFQDRLKLAFGVVLVHTGLTAIAPFVGTESGFLAWIVVCSLALGIGVPVTFSMTADLIAVPDRGLAAALITGLSFFLAEVFPTAWRIDVYALQSLIIMIPGVLGLGLLAFSPHPLIRTLVAELGRQHRLPVFGRGRFVRRDEQGRPHVRRSLVALLLTMFAIYFVDSLGFLRLLDEPMYMRAAWQSPDLNVRLFIALTHVVAAFVAGTLYMALTERGLFLWILGLFAMVHLMYRLELLSSLGGTSLSTAMLYAITVSLYTVVNFALWADISIPETILVNTALGVAAAGWTATFLSTALSIQWRLDGMPLDEHFNRVDSLALLFFTIMLVLVFFQPGTPGPPHREAG